MAFETEGMGIGLGHVRTHVNGMQRKGSSSAVRPFHVDTGKCIVLLVLGLGNELVMPYLQ